MANPNDPSQSDFFSADLSTTPSTGKAYTGGLMPLTPPVPGEQPPLGNLATPQRGQGLPPMASHQNIVASLDFMRNNHQGKVVSPYQAAKSIEFGGGMDHMKFERYYGWSNLYQEHGFNPMRDNESFYNEHSSWGDDMVKASTQWSNLFSLGMRDAFSFGSMLDEEASRDYAKAVELGSSSKGGLSGFSTNLFLNSGYSVGIMGEMVLEELALAGVTALSAGTLSELTIPLMVGRGAKALSKMKNAWSTGRNLIKTIGSLKDVNKARGFFNQALGTAGRVLNPLENTTDFLRGVNKVEDFRKMGNLAKTAHGFGAFYRDVRNVRLAFGESSLEGGMVQNDLKDDLFDNFVANNGRTPNEQEMEAIADTARKAGLSTTWANLPTIFFSNKLVFDNMFKTFNPMRNVGADVIEKGLGGNLMFNRRAAKDAFEVVEKNWQGWLKAAKNPRGYATVGMNYFKANFAEGLQETAQETISGAAKDYYTARYEGSPLKGGAWAAIADNLQEQFSGQGFETFMSGFLMGGLIQPVTKAPGYFKQGVARFKDPSQYKAKKTEAMAEMNEMANKLNKVFNDPEKYFNEDLANLDVQQQYERAATKASSEGDRKAYHDIKDASLYDHVYTALKTGRMDTLIERMQDMKNLTPEDVEGMPTDMNHEQYQARLDKSIARAKDIEKRYNFVQKKKANPFNPKAYERGSYEQYQSFMNYAGWADAQKEFIFNGQAFDRTLERMNSIMGEAKTDSKLANMATSDFNVLFDGTMESVQKEMDLLDTELQAMDSSNLTKAQIKDRKYKAQKKDFLKNYMDAMSELMEVSPEPTETQTEEGVTIDKADMEGTPASKKAMKKAYNAFERYLKHVAGQSKDYVFDENIQEAFAKLIDYQMLSRDARNLEKAVNIMTSPKAFMERAERLSQRRKDEFAKRDQEIENALKKWKEMIDTNRLLQLLSDINVFFDPAEIQPLLTKGIMPSQFYELNSKNGSTGVKREIQKNSRLHRKARNIIRDFVQDIMDIPIPEAEGGEDGYNHETRKKLANDKRTYSDIAEQFGFDPEAASSEVPLAQVLDAVINSKYATQREKALATRLRGMAKDGEIITFVNNHPNPGSYSPIKQTTIDARYSSKGYRGGDVPVEFVILHEEIHRRTVEGLKRDPEFNKSIKALMAKVKEFTSKPENQALYGDKPFYGMTNEAEFVAEAMSNQEFQTLLSAISYEGATGEGSTWTHFVDEVLKFFRRMWKRNATGTVMNAAFDIITTKIDDVYGTPTDSNEVLKGKIEARRQADIASNSHFIVDKSESRSYTKPDGSTVKVVVDTLLNGEFRVIEYTTDSEGNITESPSRTYKPEDSTKEEVYRGANRDNLIYSAVVEEEVKDKILNDINKKYDRELAQLSQREEITAERDTAAAEILPTTPFAQLQAEHPELIKKLVQAYKDSNADLVRRGLEPHEENWEMMSDDDILRSGFFRNTFIKRMSPARKVFRDYNRDNGRTGAPQAPPVVESTTPQVPPAQEPGQNINDAEYADFVDNGNVSEARIHSIAKKIRTGIELNERENAIFTAKTDLINTRLQQLAAMELAAVPTQWNRALKQQVIDLGYTEDERRAMSLPDAWRLVQEGLTKEQRNDIELADQEAARAELEEQRGSILQRIDTEIAEASNYEELLAVEAELLAEFASNPELRTAAGLTGSQIEAKIQARKEQMAFDFTFDDFVVGEVVIMNNRAGTKVVVNRITSDTIFGTDISDPSKRYKIRRGTEQERVKYKYSPAMAEVTIPVETVTPEGAELSNESLQTGLGLNNQQSIQQDIADGRNSTDEDLDNDLLDNVNECE